MKSHISMDTGPSLNITVHFYSYNVSPTLTRGEPPKSPCFLATKNSIIKPHQNAQLSRKPSRSQKESMKFHISMDAATILMNIKHFHSSP